MKTSLHLFIKKFGHTDGSAFYKTASLEYKRYIVETA